MYKISFIFCLMLLISQFSIAQDESIQLANPSFEDNPHSGTKGNIISGWQDCGVIYFSSETPPDIHYGMDRNSNSTNSYFGVRQPASQGFTFLGFVVRNNETYESVSQRLSSPIEGGKCYEWSIDLSKSSVYISPFPQTDLSQDYTRAVVLRVYGGSEYCGKRELLAESEPVNNTDWKTYSFTFTPKQSHRYFTISAFYKVPVLVPYNGNLLLDNASEIKRIPCPGDELVAQNSTIKADPKTDKSKTNTTTKLPVKKDPIVAQKEPVNNTTIVKEPKAVINKELDRKTITLGQKINLKNLYFEADAIDIDEKSHPALEELADFLKINIDVNIEIGGHTNGLPPHEFCDSLSTARAKSVADYLFSKGIPKSQVEYKGYGKRQPIKSNKFAEGRQKNQRVEIKVIKVG